MAGFVTSAGVFVAVAGQVVPLPPVHTPLRHFVDVLLPCPHCGKYFGCDCLDWFEWMLLAEPQEDSSND